MFKLFYQNRKKGFTVIELIVAITITGIVLTAFGFAFYGLQESYNKSILRARVTSAVQLATQKFETSAEQIANSKQVDVLYDPIVAGGILYRGKNPDGTADFEWGIQLDEKGEARLDATGNVVLTEGATPYILPKEDEDGHDDEYTYIFSTPAFDETGKYLGYFLFIRNSYEDNGDGTSSNISKKNSILFLENEGSGEVPIQVEFGIATDEIPNNGTWAETTTNANGSVTGTTPQYTNNCLRIVFKSGNEKMAKIKEVETTYSLINFSGGKKINYDMSKNTLLVMEEKWVFNGVAKAYPCGWNNAVLGTPSSGVSAYSADKDANGNIYTDEDGNPSPKVVTVDTSNLARSGNVLRFLSPLNDHSIKNAIQNGGEVNVGRCPLEDYFLTVDTSISEPIITGLKGFRDNVLKGTVAGDWFIDFYYNSFKPFYFENKENIMKLIGTVKVPASQIYKLN